MKISLRAFSLIVVVCLGITSSIGTDEEIWKITNLSLIVPGYIIKEHGVLRPDSDWESMEPPKENQILRKEICEMLFKTPYFVKYHLRWIDTDSKEEREYLVNSYPDTIPSNFKETASSSGRRSSSRKSKWFPTKINYQYDSSYRLASTDMNCGKEDANSLNVFPCLVERSLFKMGEEIATKKLYEYFVSEPFHVDAPHPHFDVTGMVGRLVFTRSSGVEILRIEAFAAHPDKWVREFRIARREVENPYGFYDLEKLANRTRN